MNEMTVNVSEMSPIDETIKLGKYRRYQVNTDMEEKNSDRGGFLTF